LHSHCFCKIEKKIKSALNANDPNAVAYLFGSDCDILIRVDNLNVTNEIEDKFRNDLYDIELESGQVISAFIYPKDNWVNILIYSPLYKNVKREGIPL
jgi:hypothetical protein